MNQQVMELPFAAASASRQVLVPGVKYFCAARAAK